jgi:hypothetical protein
MAQRTRMTVARVAWAGAALILGAGLTGCLNDNKKPIKAVGPPPGQSQTKIGTTTFPSGPGQYPYQQTGTGATPPGMGMGANPGTTNFNPANGLNTQPGAPGTIGSPIRQTTGTGAPAGGPMPGVGPVTNPSPSQYNYPSGGPGATNTTPGYGGNTVASSVSYTGHPAGTMENFPQPPPAPPQSLAPPVGPIGETPPPTAGPLAPTSPFAGK